MTNHLKMIKYFLIILIIFSSCTFEKPTDFSEKALKDLLLNTENKEISLKEILQNHKEKKVFITLWASWCGDCIKGIPELKKIQSKNPSVSFVFISVDKSLNSWKNGIKKYQLEGNHYYLPKGMKNGDFVNFIGLSWIPRYLIVDKNGKIALFKATKITDKAILETLKVN